LHQPLGGLAETPDHLADLLIDAPYRAAAGVFDLALAEGADFVLLAGGLLDPRSSGPRAWLLLAEQFARLTERGIAVYWATAPLDCRGPWPAAIHWPANVHFLSADPAAGISLPHIDQHIHVRGGEPICQIFAADRDWRPSNGATPLAPDLPPADGIKSKFAGHYIACGGTNEPSTARCGPDERAIVHRSGSPQGRGPADIGRVAARWSASTSSIRRG
jgi:hypothetical protein